MQVCKHFFVGFPHWWQSCNLHYPKRTNSDTGYQPCSSNTSKYPDGLKNPHAMNLFSENLHIYRMEHPDLKNIFVMVILQQMKMLLPQVKQPKVSLEEII
jgi:hypothetical protein